MMPVNLGGCFGWLHLPKNKQFNTAIVLCPGIKTDELAGYRSLRVLADTLADSGYPVLRLHYVHTGNSVEIGNADFWPTWQSNIHHAIDWIRSRCGVDHVTLCGLRFGAMLASVVAAARNDVSGLILLAPVLRGRTYMRQLRSDGYFSVGARLTTDDIDAINNLDLKTAQLSPECQVLMLAQSVTSLAVTEFVDLWRSLNVDVTLGEFTGLECMLRPTFLNHKDEPGFTSVVEWLRKTHSQMAETIITHVTLPDVVIEHSQWIEMPLTFGQNLFGVLCRPHRPDTDQTVVVLGNSSADPHCAINIAGLARHLAAKGIPSLRVDFAGVGDSDSSDQRGTHVFEIDRSKDFSAAIDALASLGYSRFATEGLCSGAFHAYHGAMTDPRVSHSLLVNLPFFEWLPGYDVEKLVFHDRKPEQLLREMRTKNFWFVQWQKVRQGDLSIITNRFVGLKRRFGKVPGFRRGAIRSVERRDVNLLFLVSEGDISNVAIQLHYKSRLPPNVKVTMVDGMDHTMQRPGMCSVVAHQMTLFLTSDNVPSSPVSNVSVSSGKQVACLAREVSL